MNVYESDRLLDEYLLFHYGSAREILTPVGGPAEALGFPVRSVVENAGPALRRRALDLGCAVGRSSFELSRFSDEVVGLDLSRRFIAAAEELRGGRPVGYRRHDEGHGFTELVARAPVEARPGRVRFAVADAGALPGEIGDFDLVHAANLLCRLPRPQALVDRFADLVRPGGTLVITTPCTWLAEFTPPENWPPGPTLDWLRQSLADGFTLDAVRDQPFLIREHARKFQWSIAQASIWTRRRPHG